MKRDELLKLARSAGARTENWASKLFPVSQVLMTPEELERFAVLVIANHPPQSYMSCQVGLVAGVLMERDQCILACEDVIAYNSDDPAETFKNAIRARGNI